MDPQSPPKRMTRARAAAKSSDNTATTTTRTTRIVTAAAKAKVASTTTRTTTSTKRKTRSDDNEHDDEQGEATESEVRVARPRGRPRKAATEETEEPMTSSAPARATRARAAARKASVDAPKSEPKAEPVKATRGRPRKTPLEAESTEAPKKATATRSRAATVTAPKTAPSRKRVTFEEPEKENVDPAAGSKNEKAPANTGLRGRPVRKPAVPKATKPTTTRTTAASDKAKTPLSPKKVTQISHAQDMSEDELTADSPVRPMQKNPAKPPSSSLSALKKSEMQPTKEKESEPEAQEAADEVPEVTLVSPAKRPPSSPYKDSMKSPAKRADGAILFKSAPSLKSGSDTQATPFKSSLLSSPAKRPQSAIKGFALPSAGRTASGETRSPMKMSLMQTPAKRPAVPIKSLATPARPEPVEEIDDTPAAASPCRAPVVAVPPAKTSSEKLLLDEQTEAMDQLADELMLQDTMTLQFPGRLSAVLPRYADPSLKDNTAVLYEKFGTEQEMKDPEVEVRAAVHTGAEATAQLDDDGDSVMTDEAGSPVHEVEEASPMPLAVQSAPKRIAPGFGLREKDTNPYHDFDSESDDELSPTHHRPTFAVPATPTPAASSRRSLAPRASSIGFTPLAEQFSTWAAGSPAKRSQAPVALSAGPEPSPIKSSYFEDEMTVRSEAGLQAEVEPAVMDNMMVEVGDPEFNDILVTEEDMELAAEADEMSLMEPEQIEEANQSYNFDDSISDASQEYGDENEMPVDPAMLRQHAGVAVPPITPRRVFQREFHTVSKVPLKASDESTPRPRKKRAASISRLPVSRPIKGLTRSATVISYSPTKSDSPRSAGHGADDMTLQQSAPATPTRSESWSATATPARTPRRDLNPTLLNGAVVFVDVHTSEGADASSIFVELLTQMGAGCVKNWLWNSHAAAGADSSRIGITHVVYKDGDKETLEKVRQTAGVVQCVGVSWVLDCERENQWLDEAPYYIEAEPMSHGGGRRRQTMGASTLANMSSLLVPSPSRDARTTPNTPMNRRDSTLWIKTPSDQLEENEEDWQTLTPVPVTPAPDALARYAANVTPETPTAALDLQSPTMALGMQTCPPKANGYSELGQGLLDRQKDEGVMMRLMAARRKSLQFAPKVASPLSKAWR